MPKKHEKAGKKEEGIEEVLIVSEQVCADVPRIALIEEAFGNGDLNILRDKINEIIKRG